MKPVLKELKVLKKAEKQEKKRVKLAVHFNICPECGENLVEKKIGDRVDIVCSKDKEHYKDYYYLNTNNC